jgi:[ribosomal protein S18]-alanine N-acetyltransferase
VSGSQVVIRFMEEQDLEQVQEIDRQSFSLPWPGQSYQYELKENTASLCFVAASEEGSSQKVLGMLVAWMLLDEVHIATIAVREEHRRLGIGRMLVKAALRAAVDRGAVSATLEVREGNIAAQELYRDFCFDEVGRRHGYYKDNGEDALIMTVYDLDNHYFEWLEGEQGG